MDGDLVWGWESDHCETRDYAVAERPISSKCPAATGASAVLGGRRVLESALMVMVMAWHVTLGIALFDRACVSV